MPLAALKKWVIGDSPQRKSWQEICHDLLRLQDDATVLRLGVELLERYQGWQEPQRLEFLRHLLNEFRVDHDTLRSAIENYQRDPSPDHVQQINLVSQPQRRRLFEMLNMCPGGMPVLLEMRSDIIRLQREQPELSAVSADLAALFRNWFNRGMLNLQRIDWTTPPVLLEKLFQYEAVHEIRGWDALKQRLDEGRRCYAFFHPVMPEEPLIFVQVALTGELVDSIHRIIGEAAETIEESTASTAIFYSISNCQAGLKGIALGDLLIKQVAELIVAELPGIKTFATLSPIPGFRPWLEQEENPAPQLISDEEHQWLLIRTGENESLSNEGPELRAKLEQLCAHYLTSVGRNDRPLDSVARFHLRNGARLERLNWLGDQSLRGLSQSYGMLVNYVYDLNEVSANHERFVYHHEVSTGAPLRAALKG